MKKRATAVDLSGKHIIVTGASIGSLGFATAKILASWGARVVITTRSDPESTLTALRSASKSRGHVGGDVHVHVDGHTLDLTSADSVTAFVAWYRETYGNRLDVLINNAGIHLDLRSEWKAPTLTDDGYEIHWRTNYLGTFQLTSLLLPLLLDTAKHTGDARVVNVVSQLHNKGKSYALFAPLDPYNSWHAYGTSKLALMHHAIEIQRRYAASGVQAYCLHPGAVYTRIADKGLAGHPFIALLRKILAPVEAFFLLSPEQGAQTSVHCATAAQLPGGRYYVNCTEENMSDNVEGADVSERLWNQTLVNFP